MTENRGSTLLELPDPQPPAPPAPKLPDHPAYQQITAVFAAVDAPLRKTSTHVILSGLQLGEE